MGMTPSRMKSCLDVEVAMSSIAQQARPKFITHSEYFRPQFKMNFAGCGKSTLSMRPIELPPLHPLEDLLLPRIKEGGRKDGHKHDHLNDHDAGAREFLE